MISGIVWAVIGFTFVTQSSSADSEGLGFFQLVLIPIGALSGLIGGVVAVFVHTPSSIWLRFVIALAVNAGLALLISALLS